MSTRAALAVLATAGALSVLPSAALAAGATTTPLTPPATTTVVAPAPTTTTVPAPTTTPTPTPAPARGAARLFLSGVVAIPQGIVTVPGRAVTVTGVTRPWVPGQRVLVQAVEGGRVFAQRKIVLTPSRRRVYGGFSFTMAPPRPGLVTVRLLHSRSAGESSFTAQRHVRVLSPSVAPGARGPMVELVQARLAALHLFIPRTGVYDAGTQLALNAYHRLLGWGEGDTSVSPATVTALLDGRGSFHVRFPHQGRHAEGNLRIQVLALIDGSKVQELLPISSGKPSTPTLLGSWRIYLRTPGYLPDGMYYSSFFTGGYAIHGYDPAPDYPASHGCMRLPIVDAVPVFNWLALGDWVDTYYA